MYDSTLALDRAELAGISVKKRRFYSSDFQNILRPSVIGAGRCKLNAPPKFVKPICKQVEESIDNTLD